ncbi:MAG: hypothetical protein JKX73_08320 [Flavobacteriales bacterium]|nr:hypothetical protein [Flavobacteriales bacterium]
MRPNSEDIEKLLQKRERLLTHISRLMKYHEDSIKKINKRIVIATVVMGITIFCIVLISQQQVSIDFLFSTFGIGIELISILIPFMIGFFFKNSEGIDKLYLEHLRDKCNDCYDNKEIDEIAEEVENQINLLRDRQNGIGTAISDIIKDIIDFRIRRRRST